MPPRLEMVKHAPDMSAGFSLPSRACLASSPDSCASSKTDFLSAFLTTGRPGRSACRRRNRC